MANSFHWTCPFCDRDTTINHGQYSVEHNDLTIENVDGPRRFVHRFIVCPNQRCKKFVLTASLHEIKKTHQGNYGAMREIQAWQLVPSSKAKIYPSYIPKPILDDYCEACSIKDLSPKASAALSRRCLQGIIRDYWKVMAGKLSKEIEDIENKVDPETWEAIDAVRKVGNIGAHMEKDINVIIDVEPKEAELLLGLIETLLEDWYVARQKRLEKLQLVKAVAENKEQLKKGIDREAI